MKILVRLLLFALLFQGLLAGCSSRPPTTSDPQYVDAVELKLKIRELADQMLATVPNASLTGLVAMPTSFVDMDNKRQASPLGNLFAESLIYEFNQRGFPVCEYRLTGNIDVILGQGDFSLLRQGLVNTTDKKWAALIVGTYYRGQDAVFVNARLVRASDGVVLRTGQLLLLKNALVARLLEPLTPPAPPPAPAGQKVAKKGTGANSSEGLVSSGSLVITSAPWKSPSSKPAAAGPGLWGNPQ